MNFNMNPKKVLMGGAFSVVALVACSLVALAQPAPGAGGPGAGGPGGPGGRGPGGPGAGGPGAPGGARAGGPGGARGGGGPGGRAGRVPDGRDPMLGAYPANLPEPNPDPRDFNGVYIHGSELDFQISTDMYGYTTPFNKAGAEVMARRVKSLKDGTPYLNASAKCLPTGIPWQMDLNMPFQVFQSKDRFDILFEEFHGFVTIVMDPAKAAEPGYMGRSVAHWDGDTLVVETAGFKEPLWLDVNGTPASKFAKLTTRIRKLKSDRWYLEFVHTLDDPTYYTRPWSWVRAYDWRPDMALFRDYNCELQTGAKGGLDPSLIQEPKDD